ncbi:AAA family ATPase [Polyangium sp. 15x6]|uniref:ATP-dependent nuclease n=1 Tax=Polyangium sp. 15x6 TaxID=3042687 RepID=UPI00249CF056|nr:AAA family ATPase [Polyangium sp. 15x6]MDI3289755.1 AAA family ATPase [Polyangium sp. 15x6]
MINRLSLSNFRGFRSLDLELAPITVLVGRNATGKTTLLQAMQLLTLATADVLASGDAEVFVRADGTCVRRRRQRVVDPNWPAGLGWRNLLHHQGRYKADGFEIVASFSGARGLRRGRMEFAVRGNEPDLTVEVESTMGPPLAANPAVFISRIHRVLASERLLLNAELDALRAAGRHEEIVRNGLARLSERSIARLNGALREAQDTELVRRTPINNAPANAILEAMFRRRGTELELAASNEGLLNLTTILVEIERSHERSKDGGTLLLLDEPELHLTPRVQEAVAKRLAKLTTAGHTQVISATHSIEVAHQLGRRLQGALYALSDAFSHPRRLQTEAEAVQVFGRTHNLMPFASINWLKHRRILLHEGAVDYLILRNCARGYFRDQPHGLRRFEEWTPVALNGAQNAPASSLLSSLFSSDLLLSLDAEDRIAVVSVLDRDYERKPVVEEISSGQVSQKRKVWTRHSIESLFLDIEPLAACFSALLEGESTGVSDVGQLVSEAVSAANRDPDLLEHAEDELADVLRRTEHRQSKDAQKAARAAVRAHPEIWQRGKDRADFILDRVRRALPTAVQPKVRSTIHGMLEDIPTDRFSAAMVPDEIGEFLK